MFIVQLNFYAVLLCLPGMLSFVSTLRELNRDAMIEAWTNTRFASPDWEKFGRPDRKKYTLIEMTL
jgi:hypothetical protein